ncbi:MAG: hypothetical protein LCH37_07340 [Bacteroidetes bacterium]|nr:hypothetical protein [Bacteroidota bacterium]MCK6610648.1 hypothetical protein [Bacteroidia bacterium]
MKTIQSIVLSVMLLGGLSFSTCSKAHASGNPEYVKVKAISTEIREKINFPVELADQGLNEKVVVEFQVSAEKKVKVVSVETKNEFLKTYVKNQMETMELENYQGFEGKTMQISLFFAN